MGESREAHFMALIALLRTWYKFPAPAFRQALFEWHKKHDNGQHYIFVAQPV
jgi:hypothetical protein